jgi:hypothetical protein
MMDTRLCSVGLQDLPHQRLCKNIPVQDNHCDCGLFVLTYLEYFVHALPPALNKEVVEKAGKKTQPDEGEWGIVVDCKGYVSCPTGTLMSSWLAG